MVAAKKLVSLCDPETYVQLVSFEVEQIEGGAAGVVPCKGLSAKRRKDLRRVPLLRHGSENGIDLRRQASEWKWHE